MTPVIIRHKEFGCFILGHMYDVRVFVDYIKLLIDEYAISFAIFYYPVLSFWMKFIFH